MEQQTEDTSQAEKERRRKVARARWGLLRNALLASRIRQPRNSEDEETISKRAFPGLDLFVKECVGSEKPPDPAEDYTLVRYTARFPPNSEYAETERATVLVRSPNQGAALGKDDLSGFDNTGNICVWPSEEVLAHYCLQHAQLFRNKRVCEVGAGLGLAGLVVATCLSCECVLITDGNDKAAQNIRSSVALNDIRSRFVRGEKLRWGRGQPIEERYRFYFDFVIAADCLFLHEYHDDLLHTLGQLLRPSGVALIVAPRRGHTLQSFVEKARYHSSAMEWRVDVDESYDRYVWARHQELLSYDELEIGTSASSVYQPDIHYPLLLRLVRGPSLSNSSSQPSRGEAQMMGGDVMAGEKSRRS